jgi:hypothetical protein
MGTCVTPGVFKINRTTRDRQRERERKREEKRITSQRGKFVFCSGVEELEKFYSETLISVIRSI